jgi:hypothetical protein
MNPSYIAANQDELFDKAPPDIQELILGEEVNTATAILGKSYKIPVSSYVALENIISFILIGALQPENVVMAIVDLLELSEEDAYKLAGDLEKTILEKARIKILGKGTQDMVTLSFPGEGRARAELRKEILDTTNRESIPAVEETIKAATTVVPRKPLVLTPGSRSQLLEQLQLLGSIPNDEEVETRLGHIKDQIASIDSNVPSNELRSPIALQEFMFGEKGDDVVDANKPQTATYSKAPTQYNVDPYRELPQE